MPTRAKNAEMKQIVTNSEIHLIIASMNPEASKLGEAATGGAQ